ncbi:MAG: acetylornithine/succinylornithine family transaminase [Calditrichaeota bacterium]|nr:MAG: acetylornithine/succinylornithine family transaminase [Calditrichota bacterium]
MAATRSEKDLFIQVYKRFPEPIDHGEGIYLFDQKGRKYLDFLSGIAVNALGYNHPAVLQAVEKQLKRNLHLSNYFVQDVQLELAESLLNLTPYSKLFLSNSGTEAIEGLIKLVRKWGLQRGKRKIIAFEGGFHGRTLGAVSITGQSKYRESFQPLLPDIEFIPFNDVNALNNALDENVAGVFFEGITGEGGIVPISDAMLKALKQGKEKYDFLIITDEIQTGVGRTGYFYYYETFPFSPDAIATAKGLGGGLPLAAFCVKEEIADVFSPGEHGTTYGGNPLACAAGLATVREVSQPAFLAHVRDTGAYLMQRLKEIIDLYPDLCLDVRGSGLMCGLDVARNGSEIMHAAFHKGLIFNIAGGGKTLRFLPPLIIGKENVDEAMDILLPLLKTFR